jgi:rod shape-determining protein MreB
VCSSDLKTLTITSKEIQSAISEQVDVIVDAVRVALEQTPPELSADIVDQGIVLTGGGALLKNLDTLLKNETGMPIIVADDPLSSVVLGSGRALDNLEILREIAID